MPSLEQLHRQLLARVEEYKRQSTPGDVWFVGRLAQLTPAMGRERAFNRTSLEVFCKFPIHLPLQGLPDVEHILRRHGFYWEPADSTSVVVLFPPNWRLIPLALDGKVERTQTTAILVDPAGVPVAEIARRTFPTSEFRIRPMK